FGSVLLHELGHVWMGRVFGSNGYIILYSFGGLAIGSTRLAHRWQRICVLLAGPGIQLVLFAIVEAVLQVGLLDQSLAWYPLAEEAIRDLWSINLLWPLLNLLPVWPLDGGQVCREVLEGLAPRKGLVASLWISTLAAGALAIYAFSRWGG